MRVYVIFLGLVAATNALEPLPNTLVVSSPFQLFLQPTFLELNLEAQTIAAQSISDILSSSIGHAFHDVDVVLQDATYQGRRLQSLKLPSTTLTFAVLGSSSSNGTRDSLNKLIQNVFSSQTVTQELIRDLKTKHSFYKDLKYIQVVPVYTADESSEQAPEGFFQSLNYVDICLVVVSICVLLGVAYMVIQSYRGSRQEHERILQLLTTHAAATASLHALEQDDTGSISSRLQFLKSSIFDKKQANLHANLDATPKVTEDEETTDEEEPEQVPSKEEENRVSSQVSYPSAEHVSNSSSSYHSAQLLESSQELAASGSGSSMRSERLLSEYDVISTPPLQHSEELSLQSSVSTHSGGYSSSNHSGGYSSGMSSAHFSSSRWFQPNGILAPSEDTFDVFQVDVDKYDESLLLDDASKASRSSSFLQEWVKSIQVVVPTEMSSVAIPDSTVTPECASVHSSSQDETIKETGDCQSVTHQTAPDDKNEAVHASVPVEL